MIFWDTSRRSMRIHIGGQPWAKIISGKQTYIWVAVVMFCLEEDHKIAKICAHVITPDSATWKASSTIPKLSALNLYLHMGMGHICTHFLFNIHTPCENHHATAKIKHHHADWFTTWRYSHIWEVPNTEVGRWDFLHYSHVKIGGNQYGTQTNQCMYNVSHWIDPCMYTTVEVILCSKLFKQTWHTRKKKVVSSIGNTLVGLWNV